MRDAADGVTQAGGKIRDLLTESRVQFAKQASGWEEAVRRCAAPLLLDKTITAEYLETTVKTIAAPGGLYMDLGFGICLAHTRPENGALRVGLAALLLKEPVLLGDDAAHPICLILFLSAPDKHSHLSVMAELAAVLTDTNRRQQLLDSSTWQEFSQVLT